MATIPARSEVMGWTVVRLLAENSQYCIVVVLGLRQASVLAQADLPE
jgi:hypothetical protein